MTDHVMEMTLAETHRLPILAIMPVLLNPGPAMQKRDSSRNKESVSIVERPESLSL